jgi:hypothetical protein
MATHTADPDRLLRLALRSNATFSSTCGLLFAVASRPVGAFVGLPHALVFALGLGLLVFAGLLVATSSRTDPLRMRTEARVHCAADLAWVVGTVPVVALGLLTPAGSAALVAVSTVVLALAIAQWRGIGRTPAVQVG